MKSKNAAPVLITALLLVIALLCLIVPGFAAAVLRTIECAFATYSCVKVLP